MKSIPALFLFLTAVTAMAAAPAASEAPAGQKIFYATHSLMWDVPEPLTEQANSFNRRLQELAWKTVSEYSFAGKVR